MNTMTPPPGTVTGGVDTHSDMHVAAALDHLGGVLGTAQFRTTGLVPGLMEASNPREDERHGSTEEVPGRASGASDPAGGRLAAGPGDPVRGVAPGW